MQQNWVWGMWLCFAAMLPGFVSASEDYQRYFSDTVSCLEKMRQPNGLLIDKSRVHTERGKLELSPLRTLTSPTNIGLDIIIQAELAYEGNTNSLATLRKLLTTLNEMPYHKGTGLYYWWYEAQTLAPGMKDISSVDNLHLALALYTVANAFSDQEEGKLAKVLFDRMDFSDFLEEEYGLIHGNIEYDPINEKWKVQPWSYGFFGSEARSLYSVAGAIGLYRKKRFDPLKGVSYLNFETVILPEMGENEVMKTWDGGAFQMLLPELLVQESNYSPRMKSLLQNYATYTWHAGRKRGLKWPAAFSASNAGIDGEELEGLPHYLGHAGLPELVTARNGHIYFPIEKYNWDAVFTPHAAFLASIFDKNAMAAPFADLAKVVSSSPDHSPLYVPGCGFMDALLVKGQHKGKVVPVVLTLDQAMIALSISPYREKHGRGLLADVLRADQKASAVMTTFFNAFDQKPSDTVRINISDTLYTPPEALMRMAE